MRARHLLTIATLAVTAHAALPAASEAAVGGYQAPYGQMWQKLVPAPNFQLPSAAGGGLDTLSRYQGKVRIIDFWATWCPPCRKEIPGFIQLQKKYQAKGLVVLGISVDRSADTVNQFSAAYGINYPVVMADAAVKAAYGGIRSIPTTFIVGRKGYIYKQYVGAMPDAVFERDVKALL